MSATVGSASAAAALTNGYPVFAASPSAPLQIALGAFSASADINAPAVPYTQSTVLFTSNSSVPAGVAVTLIGGASDIPGTRVDDFNFLFQGQLTAAKGSYSLKCVQNGATLFTLPIKYLSIYETSLYRFN